MQHHEFQLAEPASTAASGYDGLAATIRRDTKIGHRRADRFAVDVDALLIFGSGRSISIRLKTISTTGVEATTPEWLRPDNRVEVVVPALGAMEIEMLWQLNGCFGGAFAEPLTPAQLFAAAMAGREQGYA